MPQPRVPTKVLQMRGAGKKHPERMRERESEPAPEAGIGPAPAHFSETESAIWDEVVSLLPAGVLGNTDRIALEGFARKIAKSRNRDDKWTSADDKDMLAYCARFGMTPSDRSRVSVPKGAKKSPWEGL